MGPDQRPPVDRKALKRRGPESLEWDNMKSTPVRVLYPDGSEECGDLVWVDRYTIGVRNGDPSTVGIIFKSNIKKVAPA